MEKRILARKLARALTPDEIDVVAGAATLTTVHNASGDISDGDDTGGHSGREPS